MARIRSIKPEFWSSPNLPKDPWARLLFVAMWNWADDSGVGTAIPRELLGFAFPNDEDITVEDLRRMLVEIRRGFGVMFYTVAGRPYYAIPSWEEHQKFDRRSKGKYPGSDEAETWLYLDECDEPHEPRGNPTSTRRDSIAGTGEQGNRGTEEQGNRTTSDPASPDGSATTKATGSKPSDRGTRIAEDFAPTAEMIVWAKSERPDLDPMAETEHFVDFWLSKPGKDGRKVKWDLTWKNWIRNARSKGPVSQPGSSKTDEWLKYAE